MSALNPLLPPLPTVDSPIFDRWLSDYLANGEPNAWDRHWFYPGRVVQSAELNEMESMIYYQLVRLFQQLFVEGQVLSGLVATNASDTVTITSGLMYIQGRIRYVAGGTVTITGTGTETVGLLYTNTSLVPESTAELMNPVTSVIVGPGQYSLFGAGRMSLTFAWAANSVAANYTRVYTFINGVLQTQSYAIKNPYVPVTYSATPVFDCSKGTPDLVVFYFPLSGNVTSSTIINLSPGQIVKFQIATGATPGLTFTWPSANIFGFGTSSGSSTAITNAATNTNFLQSFSTTGTPYAIAETPLVNYP